VSAGAVRCSPHARHSHPASRAPRAMMIRAAGLPYIWGGDDNTRSPLRRNNIWIVLTIHASQKVPAAEQLRGALGSVLSASLTAPAHRYGGCGSGLRAPLPRGVVKRGRCALPLRQRSRTDGRGPECVQAFPWKGEMKCRRLFVTVTFRGMTGFLPSSAWPSSSCVSRAVRSTTRYCRGSPSTALLPGHHSSSSTESTDRVRLRWVVITTEGRLTAFQLVHHSVFRSHS